MNSSESFNPFQAPETQDQEVTLGDDAEFLISAGEILCRETVDLPKVCIHTGETEDLVERNKTFQSANFWLAAVAAICLYLGFSFLDSSLVIGLIAVVFLVALIGTAMLPTLAKAGIPGVVTIETTWYVNTRYQHHCRRMRWVIRGILTGIMFFVGFAVGHGNAMLTDNAVLQGMQLGILTGGITGMAGLGLRIERRLRFSGKRWRGPHKGLYALTGHSRKFTETVERMIHGGF